MTFCFLIPITAIILLLADDAMAGEGVTNFITFERGIGLLTLLLILGVFSLLGSTVRVPRLNVGVIPDFAFDVVAILCFLGYIAWFLPVIKNPTLLFGILKGTSGAVYASRESLQTVPGLTTLTQAGIAYVVAFAFRTVEGRPLKKRRYKIYLVGIVLLTLLRVVLNSERLALIELAVPPVIVLAKKISQRGPGWRFICNCGPYLGLIALWIFFAVTEYFRSWVNHYGNEGGSLFLFAAHRIFRYYVFAINSAFGAVDVFRDASVAPFFSLQWLYNMPLLGGLVTSLLHPQDPTKFVLSNYADPEFNNFSGIVGYVWDFGWLGAAAIVASLGFMLGSFWRGLVSLKGAGRYIYPLMYVGFLELLRVPYLTSGRAFVFYVCIAAMIFAGLLTKRLRVASDV